MKAILAFRQAVKFAPDHAQAHRRLGDTLKALKRLDEAIAAYSRHVAIAPKDGSFAYDLGMLYLEQQKLDEALVEFRRAIAVIPRYEDAYEKLAMILKKQGNDECYLPYEVLLKLDTDPIWAENRRGNFLFDLEDSTSRPSPIARPSRRIRTMPTLISISA